MFGLLALSQDSTTTTTTTTTPTTTTTTTTTTTNNNNNNNNNNKCTDRASVPLLSRRQRHFLSQKKPVLPFLKVAHDIRQSLQQEWTQLFK
jgi:hypothetical protein